MNFQRTKKWIQLWKWTEFGTGIVILLISWAFSALAFSNTATKNQWIGYTMIIVVTLIEFIFRMKGMQHKPVIRVAGIGAYVFDLGTNVYGWSLYLGIRLDAWNSADVPLGLFGLFICVFLGFLTSVLPEALITDALDVESQDPLHIFVNLFGESSGNYSAPNAPKAQKQQQPSMGYRSSAPPTQGTPAGMMAGLRGKFGKAEDEEDNEDI